MTSSRTTRIPVLVLFGLDAFDLSKTKSRTIPSFPGIIKEATDQVEKSERKVMKNGKTPQSDIYRFHMEGENATTYYTINCNAFRGEKGGVCPYCLKSFEGELYGYAVDCHKGEYYTTDNYFCEPKHAWGYLLKLRIDNPLERIRYEDLTRNMYLDVYGVKIENPPDCRLIWSGVCTKAEFDDNEHEFRLDPTTRIIPIKQQFEKKKK